MLIPLILGLMLQQPLFIHGHQLASGCTSGAYSDTFTGSSGVLLTAYNPIYVAVDGSYPVSTLRLSGSSSVRTNSPFDNGGALVSCSTSDTFQMDIVGAPTITNNTSKYIAVRGTSGAHRGYSIAFCYSSGANWDSLCIFKDATLIQQGPHVGYDPTQTYTLKITASGSTSTLITGYINGVSTVTFTDTSSPLLSGNPGWFSNGDGFTADAQFTNAQDF